MACMRDDCCLRRLNALHREGKLLQSNRVVRQQAWCRSSMQSQVKVREEETLYMEASRRNEITQRAQTAVSSTRKVAADRRKSAPIFLHISSQPLTPRRPWQKRLLSLLMDMYAEAIGWLG